MISDVNLPGYDAAQMLARIRRWVEIETPTDVAEAVNRLVNVVEAEYQGVGAKVVRIPGTQGLGDHLIASSPWGQDDQQILVLSHLDTVHPLGFIQRLPFSVVGDSAFGPGIYDMKGGAWLGFHALAGLIGVGQATPLGVTHLLVSDEEVGSPTSRALIEAEARRAKFVLVTEPARDGGKIVTARKGVGRFVIDIVGQPAHAGARHADGRSALKELARQILVLEGMTDYARGVTVNVGVASGGTRENVVPERASAAVDLRVPSPKLAEEMEGRILGLQPHERGVTITVTGGLNRPPFVKDVRIAALLGHAQGVAAELGFHLEDVATGGGSDGNFTAPLAPTLDGLGVDGKGAHTHYEQLYVSSLEPRGRLLRRLMETLPRDGVSSPV